MSDDSFNKDSWFTTTLYHNSRRYQRENYCSGILGKGIPGTMCWESPGGRGGTWDEENDDEGWRWSGAKEWGSRSGVANWPGLQKRRIARVLSSVCFIPVRIWKELQCSSWMGKGRQTWFHLKQYALLQLNFSCQLLLAKTLAMPLSLLPTS